MLTQQHIESAKSYAMGAGVIALPAFIRPLTGWIEFVTACIGLAVIIHRAVVDYKSAKDKKNGSASKDIPPQNP